MRSDELSGGGLVDSTFFISQSNLGPFTAEFENQRNEQQNDRLAD